jgi:uncharacterized Rmd1/YagE family protein
MTTAHPKRGPTVLVTDSREPNRVSRPSLGQRANTGAITVDSILQYASDIPSARRRLLPGQDQRPVNLHRTPSGKPLDPKLRGIVPPHLPARTTKVSQKLVLLPEVKSVDEVLEGFRKEEGAPPTDAELAQSGKTYAESLPKAWRGEKIPRVTAYGVAQGYKMKLTAEFLKEKHGARTKLYDDCLYVVYHLPLQPGIEGHRIRSSPIIKAPGGKSIVDEEIERNERTERHEGYFEDVDQFGVREEPRSSEPDQAYSPTSTHRAASPPRANSLSLAYGEMFVFSYGVVVFWNFTERQEKDCLTDMTFAVTDSGVSLLTRPQPDTDFETEEFHFEYNPGIPRPRIFNDMFTLRSSDHMIKLAISHAVAQSTKLSYFEERMDRTMVEAQNVPRTLALTGSLGMKREDVVKILGSLFTSRVEVNLSSNILDTPRIFWDNEPTLNPLYAAVREYLEIKTRIQVLNERCKVFLDLAEILSDAINDRKMTSKSPPT